MTEPDVTLTDFALALLCSGFVVTLWAKKASSIPARNLWIALFSSTAIASLTGGLVHGFFLDNSSFVYQLLWPMTLLAIGLTATSAWILTGYLFFGGRKLKPWLIFAVLVYVLYCAVVLFYSQRFLVVIVNYLPAMVALLVASIFGYLKTRRDFYFWVGLGIAISFFAAFIQQGKISLHPVYFNHNATFHLVQAVGLCFLYVGARKHLSLSPQTVS